MKTKGILTLLWAVFFSYTLSAQTEQQGLRVGQSAVDFSLPDQQGKTVHLRELLRRGPVILKWYRGGWCPYCNLELKTFAENLDSIEALGATLVAISPEVPEKAALTANNNQVNFSIISDTDNHLGRKYDLVFTLDKATADRYENAFQLSAYQGNHKAELPLPATYVIDQEGIIRYAFLNTDYKQRADIHVVLKELSKLVETSH